ncbi:FAD-binding oxidoreductase [Bordetella sp. BOR01]|uniref:NAD(P)/FAD-dependent oxidoreductase n=1 Tax=Bordetella sp. BOR01 TaxID=2854779 RepID=UPI001C460D04|nr:FAD-dependent oxidoreductase [Bordetella sp. BOR01]MBV7484005.1 FAD-dependent oxidoreductase [Bordetella sp. BOR01]
MNSPGSPKGEYRRAGREGTPASAPRHVVVIGAGVVGAATAVQALNAGWRVTLVDPGEPGGQQAASYGNAGWLSSHSILPPAAPGVWKQVPRWLKDPLGPLAIRWGYLPRALPWLARYLASAWTWPRVQRTAQALRTLLADAPALHQALASQAGVPHLIGQRGLLHAYVSEQQFRADSRAWDIRRQEGIEWQELDARALRALEPDLHPRYTFGVLVPETGHCRNPGAYVAALVRLAQSLGAELRRTHATGFDIQGGRLRAVHTGDGDIACDKAVIATGIRSRELARQAGDSVPLAAERGYHAVIKQPEASARTTTMFADCKVVVNAMEDGLRVAGQVEIAGIDAAPDWRRAHILRDLLVSIYPALPAQLPDERVDYWQGSRPSMPDGLPCIGPATASADIVHAFGHGHVGLVGSARTGELVVQLIQDLPPAIPLAPFDPRRFR